MLLARVKIIIMLAKGAKLYLLHGTLIILVNNLTKIMFPKILIGEIGIVKRVKHKTTNMVRACKVINKDLLTRDELEKIINQV